MSRNFLFYLGGMKKLVTFWVVVISVTVALTKQGHLLESVQAATTNSPVTVDWVSPTSGSTVSNTILLTVNAGSTAGRISKVVWFVDGQPFQTNFYVTPNPTGFAIAQK